MPTKLYEQVKDDIPKHVGVYVNGTGSVKRAVKQQLKVTEKVLKDSLIRSLYRDAEKLIKAATPSVIDSYKKQIRYLENDRNNYRRRYQELTYKVYEKYGSRWDK